MPPQPRSSRIKAALVVAGLLLLVVRVTAAQPQKDRVPPGRENFTVAGHRAFVIRPPAAPSDGPTRWVWYAPTLGKGLPGSAEKWMFERFQRAGIAIAGIDVGESYGSPKGRAVYQALYEELTGKRGFHGKPVLLARSRGGLMLYSWAVEHPESVGGVAGIYPVCNIASYPGVERAAGAHEMTADELEAKLTEHNPIDRLAPLARAKVPIFHLHGDSDGTVPLESNSAELARRYAAFGGPVEIEVIKGQGHNMWSGWFQSRKLTDFVIARALGRPLVAPKPAAAAEAGWPQFLGPARNGISDETGLLETWPESGPREVWRVPAGEGMSGLVVRGARVVTMVQREGKQLVLAMKVEDGTELWTREVSGGYKNRMGGNGPRATPAIAAGSVFAFSADGVLVALGLEDGSQRWRHEVLEELGAKPADYGMASSPLVVENLVLVTAGAPGGTIVAFEHESGKLAWKSGSDRAGYSSPALLGIGDRKQVVAFTGQSALGLAPDSGKLLWRYPFETDFDCNIATPIEHEGRVFISSGENHGSALLKIAADGTVKEEWKSFGPRSVMRNEWQTSILVDGHLYGLDNVGSAGPVTHLNCVKIATGERVWQKQRFGKGNLIAADGKLLITTAKGELVVARISSKGYEELGRKKVFRGSRQGPALAGGKLYLRDTREVVCLDVREK